MLKRPSPCIREWLALGTRGSSLESREQLDEKTSMGALLNAGGSIKVRIDDDNDDDALLLPLFTSDQIVILSYMSAVSAFPEVTITHSVHYQYTGWRHQNGSS